MRKNEGILAFLTIFMTGFVTAQGPTDGVRQLFEGGREMIVLIIEFITNLIFDINSVDEFLFAKMLLFAIVTLIVYVVLKNNSVLGTNKAIQRIIAILIGILSVRYIPDNFIEVIFLQYSALGVGLTVFLPLMIFFFFLHQSDFGPFGRQGGWVIYGVSLISLRFVRPQDLGVASWLYWIGLLIVIIAFLFDRVIHGIFINADLNRSKKAHNLDRFVIIRDKIRKLQREIDNGNPTPRQLTKLEKQIETYEKQLRKISQ